MTFSKYDKVQVRDVFNGNQWRDAMLLERDSYQPYGEPERWRFCWDPPVTNLRQSSGGGTSVTAIRPRPE